MNGVVLLLYCIQILGTLGDDSTTESPTADSSDLTFTETASVTGPTSASSTMTETRGLMTTTFLKIVSNSRTTSPSPGPKPTTTSTPNDMFYKKECLPVLMVSGGLIIACAILLVSTLLMAWKVCQLSGRIKALSSNADLISNSEYWMGTAKKNKSKSDTEAKETSVLIADVSQTQEEMGNGTTKEEGGKVNKDEQMGDENKKEVGDTANGEAASTTPVTVAENSSSSKPQEETTDSESTKVVAASSSEDREELKDVV